MKKVLITGITGFAGSHLAEHLLSKNEYAVSGMHVSTKNLDNIKAIKERIDLHQLDLMDKEKTFQAIAEIKPDIIFHLAASASVEKSFKEPLEVIMTNVSAECNILEATKNASLLNTKIILISSAQVYGYVSEDQLPITEEAPFKPDNPYSVSKITQEYLGLEYFLAYKLRVVRLRPFNHIGTRLSPYLAVSRFAKSIVAIERGDQDPVLTVGNLTSKRDFTDIHDMVRAYELAAEKGKDGDVYNIGTGTSHSMQKILEILLSFSDAKITLKKDESLLRPSDIPELRCDASKFMNETGWNPEVKIEQSLKAILEYWRSKEA